MTKRAQIVMMGLGVFYLVTFNGVARPVFSVTSQIDGESYISGISDEQWEGMSTWSPSGANPLPLSPVKAILSFTQVVGVVPEVKMGEWEVNEVSLRGHRFRLDEERKWFYVVTFQKRDPLGPDEMSFIVMLDGKVILPVVVKTTGPAGADQKSVGKSVGTDR